MSSRRVWRPGIYRISGLAAIVVAAAVAVVLIHGAKGSPSADAEAAAAGCALPSGTRVAAPSQPSLGPSAWTVFQGSASHNLLFPASTSSGPLQASWVFHPNGEIGAAPSVVGGILYDTTLGNCVFALDAATGHELWAFPTDNMLMSEPLVEDGRVFVGTGNKVVIVHKDGSVLRGTGPSSIYALDARTGKKLWAFQTKGENMPTELYADGTVYAADGSGTVYALDAQTGKLKWTLGVKSVDSMSSPDAWGDVAVIGGAAPYAFYGVNLKTGKEVWKTPVSALGGVDDVTPTIAGGVAYVQVPEGVYPNATVVEYALDVATGKIRWEKLLGKGAIPVSDKEETGVADVVGGVVYVGSPALNAIYALDAKTGAMVWSAPAPIPAGARPSPTVVGNDILVLDSQGHLDVIAKATGRLLHSLKVGTTVAVSGADQLGECASPAPMVLGNTVYYAGGADALLVAEPLADVLAGRVPTGVDPNASVTMAGM